MLQANLICEDIIQITDGLDNYCYLIIGNEYCILFDTLLGCFDLKGFIEQYTSLPVIVINSHAHFDHIGGNYQFKKCYLDYRDLDLIDKYKPKLPLISKHYKEDFSKSYSVYKNKNFTPLYVDTRFCLGNLTVQVIDLSSHTKGSIGLFIKEKKLLLASDALSCQICLFFDESLSLEHYKEMVLSVKQLDIEYFYVSHFKQRFPIHILDEYLECIKLKDSNKGIEWNYQVLPYLSKPRQNTPTSTSGEMNAKISFLLT